MEQRTAATPLTHPRPRPRTVPNFYDLTDASYGLLRKPRIDKRVFRQIERNIEIACARFPGSAFAPYIRFTDAMHPEFENPDLYMIAGAPVIGELPLIEVSPYLAPVGRPPRLPLSYVEHRNDYYEINDIARVVTHEVSHLHVSDYLHWGRSGPFDLFDAMCEFVEADPGDYVQLMRAVIGNHPRLKAHMSRYGRNSVARQLDEWQATPFNWGSPEETASFGHGTFRGWSVFAGDPVASESLERWNGLGHDHQVAALQLEQLLTEALTDATAKWVADVRQTAKDPFATLVGRLVERELRPTLPDGRDRRSAVLRDWAQLLSDYAVTRWLPVIDGTLAQRVAHERGFIGPSERGARHSDSTRPASRYVSNRASLMGGPFDWEPTPSRIVSEPEAVPLIPGDEWHRPGAVWLIEFDEQGELADASLFRKGRQIQPNFPVLRRGFRDRMPIVLPASRDQDSVDANRVAKHSLSYLSSALVLNAIGSTEYERTAELALFTDWALARGRRFYVTEEAIKTRIEQKMLGENVNRSRWGQFLYVELHPTLRNGAVLTVTHDNGLHSRVIYSQDVDHNMPTVSLSLGAQQLVANQVMNLATQLVAADSDNKLRKIVTDDYIEQFAGLADGPIRIPLTDVETRAQMAGKVVIDTHKRIESVATPSMLKPLCRSLYDMAPAYVAQSILAAADHRLEAQRLERALPLYLKKQHQPTSSVDEELEAAHRLAIEQMDLSKLHRWDREHIQLAVEQSAHTAKQYARSLFEQNASREHSDPAPSIPRHWRGPGMRDSNYGWVDSIDWRQLASDSRHWVMDALSAIGNQELENSTIGAPPIRDLSNTRVRATPQRPERWTPALIDRTPARLHSKRERPSRGDGPSRGLC